MRHGHTRARPARSPRVPARMSDGPLSSRSHMADFKLRLVRSVPMFVATAIAFGAPARGATESGQVLRTSAANLYYEVRGTAAGRPLFMVNGGPGFEHSYVHCSDAWDVLARKRRVVFYDQ